MGKRREGRGRSDEEQRGEPGKGERASRGGELWVGGKESQAARREPWPRTQHSPSPTQTQLLSTKMADRVSTCHRFTSNLETQADAA